MGLFAYHASLVGDAGRLAAYAKGIAEVVEEGDVVLDVGTGTGVLALLACCAGARRVYAVEQGPAVELARVVARGSRFGDRIVLIDQPSASIELPEQVDVIVTETLWNFGLGERMLGAIVDARDRFLKPGGAIVPRSLHLFAALVNSEALYGRFVDVWSARRDGVDLSALRPYAANNVYSAHLTDADLASAAAPLLDVSLLDSSSVDVEAQATVEVLRAGPIHGLGGWFRADLSDTASLSNAPPLATSNWLHAFLPFDRPLEPGAGTEVTITVATLDPASYPPEGRKFFQDYKSEYGEVPDSLAALGYDATRVAIHALRQAKQIDGPSLRDAIARTKDFPGVAGTITIDEKRNAVKPAVVLKVTGGKTEVVASIAP
jgi:protein arginine N-methyltransferase 1